MDYFFVVFLPSWNCYIRKKIWNYIRAKGIIRNPKQKIKKTKKSEGRDDSFRRLILFRAGWFATVGFIGSVGAISRAVAELLEADASRAGHAQQFAQRTLVRIESRVGVDGGLITASG
jgi:hypothetical protein